MVKRFSVSVSDDLGERFEPYKERLSPSSIFQKALEAAVVREERFNKTLKEDTPMQAVIERLKEEKAKTSENLYEIGRQEGLQWAKAAPYDDLIRAVNFTPPSDLRAGTVRILDFQDCREDMHTLEYKLYEFFQEHPEHSPGDNDYLSEEAESYVNGLLESIAGFWEEVEPHLG